MNLQANFFYSSLCHLCKQPSKELKRCSLCKCIYYCSSIHQAQDWKYHKRICKHLTDLKNNFSQSPRFNFLAFNKYTFAKLKFLKNKIKQELYTFENQIILFPKVCAVCCAENQSNYFCHLCLSIAFCSEKHEKQHRSIHEKFCNGLKLSLELNRAIYQNQVTLQTISWCFSQDMMVFYKSADELFAASCINRGAPFSLQYYNYVLTIDHILPGVTILHALERSGFITQRQMTKDSLIIHIVGADYAESLIFWQMIFELYCHWIINLKQIEVMLIGPNALYENQFDLYLEESNYCPQCRSRNVTKNLKQYDNYYHDIAENLAKPDIIVAFNPGLSAYKCYDETPETDTWESSIPFLTQNANVPLLLTAYTEKELHTDIKLFSNIKYIVNPQKNPFTDMRPIRNWELGEIEVFYQNHYMTIISKN